MVSLKPMTRQMCHEFYQNFQNDPAIGHYYEYVYTPEIADRYFDTNSVADRKLFAIMVGDQIVGECKLRNIDFQKRECSMGIHLQNDAVKGKGYGTQAERLVLQYAFEELGMVAVNADAVLKNMSLPKFQQGMQDIAPENIVIKASIDDQEIRVINTNLVKEFASGRELSAYLIQVETSESSIPWHKFDLQITDADNHYGAATIYNNGM